MVRERLQKIDILRGLALLAMLIYHCGWDLAFFGYIPPEMPRSSAFIILARATAAAFLILSGFSLFLAQGAGFRPKAFFRRFLLICLAAAAVSAITWLVFPQDFVYFGILHEIALSSLAGLLFLRAPLVLNCAAIIVCLALPRMGLDFSSPALWWLGLSRAPAASFDYVPLFPWFACALAGQSLAALLARRNILSLLQNPVRPLIMSRFLQFIGRHSLIFYLIHQPLLLGGLYLFAAILPPPLVSARAAVEQNCAQTCRLQGGEQFCRNFCACAAAELARQNLLRADARRLSAAEAESIAALRADCAAQAQTAP